MRKIAAAALLVPLLLAANSSCEAKSGKTTSPQTGTNASSAPAEAATDSPNDAPSDSSSTSGDGLTAKFGQTFTYEDGLSITVSAPGAYKPGEYAVVDKFPFYRQFTVVIVNKTGKRYKPGLFSTTLQSGDKEGDEAFDSANGFDGSPDTVLLNGRQAKFKIAYGLQNPKDIVLEVNPGFDYDNVVFTL